MLALWFPVGTIVSVKCNIFRNKPPMYGRKILLPSCTQTHSHARTLTHSLTHPRTRTQTHIHTHTHTHTHPYIHHTHTIHTPYVHTTYIHTTYIHATYIHTHTHTMHTHCVTSSIRLRQGLNVVIIAENSASCHLGANAPQICYALRTTHKISSDVVELWEIVLRAVYLFLYCLYETVFSHFHYAHFYLHAIYYWFKLKLSHYTMIDISA